MSMANTGNRCRVLVVEDDLALCELACYWLDSLGHDAVPSNSAVEALDTLRSSWVDVLFTDFVMPGTMNGLELAAAARLLNPELRVVVTSGDCTRLPSSPHQGLIVLGKPYTRDDLAQAISTAKADRWLRRPE